MKRTKEAFTREAQVESNISGCREFVGEDLSIYVFMQPMTPESSSSKISKRNGSTSKWKKKDKGRNKRNMKTNSTTIKLWNSTE